MLTKKQRKTLITIITSLILFIICKCIPFESFGENHKIIELCCYFVPYIICGASVLKKAALNIVSGRVFDENFLMAIATIGALCLGLAEGEGGGHSHNGAEEAAMVVILYKIGTLFESIAAERSRKSIKELTNIMPDFANVLRNGKTVTLNPQEVCIGETIVIKAGEKVPLDGKVIKGSTQLDTSALTGESVPLNVREGDRVISGSINGSGVIEVEVESEYSNSTVGKILDLIENASAKKAKTENFITRFAAIYTPVVVFCAAALAIIPPIFNLFTFTEGIHRALTFLVISCPCALVISVPLSFFGGMAAASKKGILIKGASYLEQFSKVKYMLFDKTGTLTNGTFSVTAIHPEKVTEAELLRIAAAVESYSDHPISISLVSAYGKVPDIEVKDVKELSGEGIMATAFGKTILIGNEKLMEAENIDIKDCPHCHIHKNIGSTIHIAMDNEYMGHIVISDQIKSGAENTISLLKKFKIKTVMLSGDSESVADAVGKEIGIDEVHSNLLPADKVEITEKIMEKRDKNKVVAFVGDGINDAPVLMRADVGISMGALGSDAAIEAADIVIMDDSVEKLITLREIAKMTMLIVKENIIFAIGIKLLVLLFGAFTQVPMWLAIFADVGVTILATLNASRAMLINRFKK